MQSGLRHVHVVHQVCTVPTDYQQVNRYVDSVYKLCTVCRLVSTVDLTRISQYM